jgi:hypothetical protein
MRLLSSPSNTGSTQWTCRSAGAAQNNGSTKKLRNRICVDYTERTSVGYTECSSSVFFTLCTAHFSGLVIMFNDNPCERIRKWETCPILKEGRSFVHI